MKRQPKGMGDVTGSMEMSAMERATPDEILAILEDRELLTPEAKRVIKILVRDELEELVKHIVRQVFREEVFPVLKRLLNKIRKEAPSAIAAPDVSAPVPAETESPVLAGPAQPVAPVEDEQEASVSLEQHTHCFDPDTGEPVCSPDELSDYRPPIEPLPTFEDVKGILRDPDPAPGTRTCLCCGGKFTLPEKGGHNQKHCGSCDSPMRIKRNQAIVHALWTDYPEIAEQVVAKLKEKGEWPNG